MISENRARLLVVAAALLFSTGGAAIKATELTAWQVAGLRSGIAALALPLMMPAARRRWSGPILVVGCAYAATLLTFVHANKLTTGASAIFLQATSPLYILFLAPWLLREPIRRRDLPLVPILLLGLVAFFYGVEPAVSTAPNPMLGNLVACLCGFLFALTIIGLRWLRGGAESGVGRAPVAIVCGNTLAFVASLPWLFPLGGSTAGDWLVVGYLGVFQIGLAYCFLTLGIRSVRALEASLLLLVEPVLSAVWNWWLHGEEPSPWSMAGGLLVLLGATAQAWLQGASGPSASRLSWRSRARSPSE